MSSIEVSALAQTDLLNIYLYGAEVYGRDVALRYTASLHEAFSLIAKFPKSSFTKSAGKAFQLSALSIARN